jgi:hypothetical protein
MQRVRTSLPYFKAFGWKPTVIAVDPKYADMVTDELLIKSVPADIQIHFIKAFDKKLTSKLGLGSLALRSLWQYFKKVNQILKQEKVELIYFSTTQFPVMILGAYWKKRFKVPYVIDMQDPWHSEYYQDKLKGQRPKKYWFSYRLNKYLEPLALKQADGLISVSPYYITDLKARYPVIKNIPSAVITFGAFEPDLDIASAASGEFKQLLLPDKINIVYVGRGGLDMHQAISPLFKSLKKGLDDEPELFIKLKFYFIGTSYAPAGKGKQTISSLAKHFEVDKSVIEITDRISYYHTIITLNQADALFIPGSDDPRYTASKIYPYLLSKKPLVAIFNKNSSVVNIINECTKNALVFTFDTETNILGDILYQTLSNWAKGDFTQLLLNKNFEKYSAENQTEMQTEIFEKAIKHYEAAYIDA